MQQVFQTDPKEPHVPEEIIRFLQTKFPLAAFKNCRSEQELHRYQGAQEVIDFLQALHTIQTS